MSQDATDKWNDEIKRELMNPFIDVLIALCR